MITLGIETTCDETAASVVLSGFKILSNVVASSSDMHKKYGGVFPEVACRRHSEVILPVIQEALEEAKTAPQDLSAIAVAKGPGLIGALLIGLQAAKGLALAWNKPLIGVNHVEAHLYAAMMSSSSPPLFPALGLVLSGGHTLLLQIHAIGSYTLIGTTVDDAIGEAFDKVATLIGLTYPGGPPLEALARCGDPCRFSFKGGTVKKNPFDFSFSGLKTSVLYAVKDQKLSDQDRADVAASFQQAAFSDIVSKAKKGAALFSPKAFYFGGGVCNNRRLKQLFEEAFPATFLFWPAPELTLDNGAMIAGLGYHKFLERPEGDPLDLAAEAHMSLSAM